MENEVVKADRLSNLPEHLIHHIMSFILSPRETTRFSFSSKRLSSIFTSFPVIDFDFTLLYSSDHDKNLMFLKFVRDSLERRRSMESSFERLNFCVTTDSCEYGIELNLPEVLENMLNFAIDKNIRELKLSWDWESGDFYNDNTQKIKSLPNAIFSSQTIKEISFNGLKFSSNDTTILINSPSIEYFSIKSCIGFKSIEVGTSVKLMKRLEIYECSELERIHMVEDSPARLESFTYNTGYFTEQELPYCEININLASRESLKSFVLQGTRINEELLQNHVCKFVSLENLSLIFCKAIMKNLCINNDRLKYLTFLPCGPLEAIDISVPGLESFAYYGSFTDFDEIDIRLKGCTSLKNLELERVAVTDKLIRDIFLTHGLIFLEKLKFQICSFTLTNPLKLYFENLKSLDLHSVSPTVDENFLEIESPNLVSFIYTGQVMLSLPVVVMSYNTQISANVCLPENRETRLGSYEDFRDFLSLFGHCNTLFISGQDSAVDLLSSELEDLLIYPKQLRKTLIPPLYELKHLKIQGKFKSNVVELVDGLLYLVPHPETISFTKGSRFNPELQSKIKFDYGTPVSEVNEDNETCCSLSPLKCWRHDLIQVAMENFEDICRINLQRYFIENAKAGIKII